MEVTVLIPRHVDDPIPTLFPTSPSTPVITLHVSQSRMVWRELEPCLFLKGGRCWRQRRAQRHMLLCLLAHFYWNNNNNPPASKSRIQQPLQNENGMEENDDSKNNDSEFALFRQRRIRLGHDLLSHFLSCSSSSSSSSSSTVVSYCYPSKLILLIQPPKIMSHFEYHWEKLLIYLEHRLILAQSLAGLYSTLGGGCFMTRRMSTAIVLAQQQQRMALILNDMDMYYKSQINAAYNLIYIGQFQAARLLLRHVRNAVTLQISEREQVEASSSSSSSCLEDISNGNQKVRSGSDDAKYRGAVVLIRMCRAARVFAKRVEKAAGRLGGGPAENIVCTVPPHNNAAAALPSSPKTVDDYARIRLVQDQSTSKDLLGLVS